MYKDPNSSSGSGASAKGDEVELVSRFLAPLCARDEAARNIALAAARTTVEGWLGGVGSPNQWEDATEIENPSDEYGKFKGQDGRYDMSVERSPRRSLPKKLPDNRRCENTSTYHHRTHNSLQETFRIESFFPRSVTENPQPFIRELSLETSEKLVVGTVSYDCVDGRFGTETSQSYGGTNETWQSRQSEGVVEKLGRSNSSDEGKGIGILDDRTRRFRDTSFYEARFSSSNESERKFVGYGATQEMYDEACNNDEPKAQQRITKINSSTKIGKATRQKQLDDDDLDSDTRIYGKSPKFDESHSGNFGPYESITKSASYTSRNDHYLDRYDRRNLNVRTRRFHEYADETCLEDEPRYNRNRDGVVFNTLEGFDGENMNAAVANLNDDELEDYADYPDEEYTENMNLENPDDLGNKDKIDGSYGIVPRHTDDSALAIVNNQRTESYEEQQQYLRNARTERKFSAGQIKRPLSQDEDVSAKSGRTLEGPEVTPGDVGRMLNLGNALDGPRQAQANKYLSLVTLHLPVILRLSVNCPFENVRIKCAEILLMVKDRGLPVPEPAFDGPSAFVPTSEDLLRTR